MSLLDELVFLETELLRNARRADADFVERVLHPEAHEVGRSGRCYDRAAMVALLAQADAAQPDAVRAAGFTLRDLGPDLALLRYRTWRDDSGCTERSSLWQRHAGRWTLRFHQGTPAD
jgi:hypothetical protein